MKKKPPSVDIRSAIVFSTILAVLAGLVIWFFGEGDTILAVVTVALVWATLLLGLATLQLAQIAFDEIQESRRESELAREQSEKAIRSGKEQSDAAIEAERVQNEELIRASHRPLMVPKNSVAPVNLMKVQAYDFSCDNLGSGVALNIQVALLPKKGEFASVQYHGFGATPLASGSPRSLILRNMDLLRFDGHKFSVADKVIELAAPMDPPVGQRGLESRPEMRLTFTYEDLFGVKHASIYDMLADGTYICVAVLKGIPYHIDELDGHTDNPQIP